MPDSAVNKIKTNSIRGRPGIDFSTVSQPIQNRMPSSVVAAFHYDESSSTLRVVYVSGAVYDYKGVPRDVYTSMKKAGSKGHYLNTRVKGYYPFVKIK